MKNNLPSMALDALLLGAALVFQQTLAGWIAFGGVRPDFMLIALLIVSLRRGPVAGLYAGLFLGLLQDVYAVQTLGANVLAKSLIGYAAGFFEEKVMNVMAAIRVLLLGVSVILHDAVFYFATGLRGAEYGEALLRLTLPGMVYTLVPGALIFYVFASFQAREN